MINKLLSDFFKHVFHRPQPTIETGEIALSPHDIAVKVPVYGDIQKVWLSITSKHNIYNEHFSRNYVSDVIILPDGFQFKVQVHSHCKVNWLIVK